MSIASILKKFLTKIGGSDMDRFEAIPKTTAHGWYVEDTWTGKTVCDMYYVADGKVHDHHNAEAYARSIAQHLNDTVEE